MVYTLDPIRDGRWTEFVDHHASASVFHSPEWLQVLRQTYGYTPIVYTTSPPSSPLMNGIVLCQVKSWLTGRRLVSLPFSDHCEPLLDARSTADTLIRELKRVADAESWKYVELRPKSDLSAQHGATRADTYYLHTLDLRPTIEEILGRTHKTSVQQSIKRAEREGLAYESGNTQRLMNAFYRLMILTRRKHRLPPQPIEWFRTLEACMGDRVRIRVAFKNGREVASILTVHYKDSVVYKYGCSDPAYQSLGGTAFLLWKTILEAKAVGLKWMDFGRSDMGNSGLIAFKNRWGARSSTLTYWRWSRTHLAHTSQKPSGAIVKQLFAMMPDAALQAAGRLLYRHIG